MPNLPTIFVTDSQADRIIGAFGTDQASAVIAYKEWLTKQVRSYVLAKTKITFAENREASEAVAYQLVLADLPSEPLIGPML